MPIYEYQCDKCHHHLEALQKFSDKPLRECPECGRHTLKRLLSAPLFRLAGSGWYETDFKSDKETKRNLAGKDEAPAATEAKDSGGDKPAPKPAEEGARKTVVAKPAVKAAARPKAPAAVKARPAAKKKAAARKTARKR
jgi:putative FmdB family regulatory protein